MWYKQGSALMARSLAKQKLIPKNVVLRLQHHKCLQTSEIEVMETEEVFISPVLQQIRKEYISSYIDIIKDITEGDEGQHINEVKQRAANVIKHITPYSKLSEGHAALDVYKLVESSAKLTPENLQLASTVSWCAAILAGVITLQDDIMDGAENRYGRRCWYKIKNVGLSAINDSFLVENLIYIILNKSVANHPNYHHILHLFHEASARTAIGQELDLMSTVDGKSRFDLFTRERLMDVSVNKNAWFCNVFPFTLGLRLTADYNETLQKEGAIICQGIGHLLHVQNDMEDAFNKLEALDQKGLDIRSGKCTWLAVETLHRGTSAQKHVFYEHYGRPSDESKQIILNLYKKLNLSEKYRKYEEKCVDTICKQIEKLSDRLPAQLFYNMLSDVTLNSYTHY